MKTHEFILVILLVISMLFSCSNDKTVNQDNNNYDIYFDDFIHFEMERYTMSKRTKPFYGPNYEAIVPRNERSMGEPFIDINDNGIYDADIDIFIMSPDDDINMDLDRNSRYTGPWPVQWRPPLPFDDLNHDNEFSWRDKESTYIYGFPFCDFNENGVPDTNITFDYRMIIFKKSIISDSQTIIFADKWHGQDWYRFVSDSGYVYRYPSSDPPKANSLPSFSFILTPGGLYFKEGSNVLQPKIIDTGKIVYMNDSLADSASYNSYTRGFFRTITPDQDLEFDGTIYHDLLMITIITEIMGSHTDPCYIFYFDRESGLIYLRYGDLLQKENEVEIYFEKHYDTLPLPMTRWYGD